MLLRTVFPELRSATPITRFKLPAMHMPITTSDLPFGLLPDPDWEGQPSAGTTLLWQPWGS